MQTGTKFLVVGPSWIGDMVMAQSLFLTLHQLHPNCRIDVLAPAWSFALLECMPEVTQAIAMPLTHGQFGFMERRRIGHSLRTAHYGEAIILPNSWKSALIPFFADIPVRTGYLGEFRYGLLNNAHQLDKSRLTQTVQRFVALAYPKQTEKLPEIPVPSILTEPDQVQQTLDKFQVATDKKILALCPGAEYGPAKRWPERHFAAVAKVLYEQGWHIFLFGSEKDRPVTESINTQSGSICQNFAGKTSIAEAIDLLSIADTVISNDSGLMHIAAALQKPLIAVYGSSDPNFTPPLNGAAHIVSLHLPCSPCFKRECPLGHTQCLVDITPEQVTTLIKP